MHNQYGTKSTIAASICLSTVLTISLVSPVVDTQQSHVKDCVATGEIVENDLWLSCKRLPKGGTEAMPDLPPHVLRRMPATQVLRRPGHHGCEALYAFFRGCPRARACDAYGMAQLGV